MRVGLGVMIQALGGEHDTVAAVTQAIGQTIACVTMDGDALRITLTCGLVLTLEDGGQSCCESRYMTCDDDLDGFQGATLASIETRDAMPEEEPPWGDGDHEVQFLVVTTSKGAITACTHNEHNGYYGGFSIEARITGGTP